MIEPNSTVNNNEITLKDLILSVSEYSREVRKRWKIIALVILPFLLFFLYQTFTDPTTYPATLTFTVNEEDGGNSGVGAILGQFGFGGGGSGEYNLEKIVELTHSRKIIGQALFETGTVNGQKDFFANHIIRQYKFHKKWKKDTTGLADFLFTKADLLNFNRTENNALQKVYQKVKGSAENNVEGIMDIGFKEETGILSLSLNSTSEELSIQFLEALYDKLSTYYIFESTEKPIVTYKNLKNKVDSLKSTLEKKELQLAQTADSNQGLVTKAAQLNQKRLEREVTTLTIAYGKAIENLEIADFSVKNAMPVFQVIDHPIAPIKPVDASLLKALALAISLGGFLGAVYIVSSKLYRETIEE